MLACVAGLNILSASFALLLPRTRTRHESASALQLWARAGRGCSRGEGATPRPTPFLCFFVELAMGGPGGAQVASLLCFVFACLSRVPLFCRVDMPPEKWAVHG